MVMGPKVTLTLQQSTETNSAYGLTTTWADEGTIVGVLTRHSARTMTYREAERENRLAVVSSYTFFCDYPNYTVTEKKRFTYGTRTFNILYVYNPGQMNHHLEIELQEIV